MEVQHRREANSINKKTNKTNKTQKYFKYLIDTSNRYIYIVHIHNISRTQDSEDGRVEAGGLRAFGAKVGVN